MCFVTLEDFSGAIEVIVFPRTFERAGPLLIPDRPIMVSGRTSITDDKIKVIAESVKSLEQLAPKEMRIRIRKEQETADVFEQLKQTFASCKGDTPVFLLLVDQNRTIKTDNNFWVNPSLTTINKIEQVLGDGAVFLA
jgi:DNA polymerase-3 subunit alpha